MTADTYQADQSGLHFLICDYFATGEGRTVCLMITTLDPLPEEWDERPGWDLEAGVFRPGFMKAPEGEVLRRQFSDRFGGWMAHGVEEISEADFLTRFQAYLPPLVPKMLKERGFGAMRFASELHLNFS